MNQEKTLCYSIKYNDTRVIAYWISDIEPIVQEIFEDDKESVIEISTVALTDKEIEELPEFDGEF